MANLLLAVIYLAFISLGLPDSLMGSAWPTMYPQFNVPVSYAGIVQFIITAGTIVSSLLSDRITFKLGAGKVTAISVAMTAVALLGFSFSPSFWVLALWAIPYGLGAGAIDAALNNYVALHYSSRHMSWLHAMWGVGTVISPNIMAYALVHQHQWQLGYRYVSFIQIGISLLIVASLPLWIKRNNSETNTEDDPNHKETAKPLSLIQTISLPMAKEVMIMFLCYCGLEGTAGLWASTYAMQSRGISAEDAATWASYFFLGITGGRLASGFIADKLNDARMIRLGALILGIGILVTVNPTPWTFITMIGLILIGVGCAPIYPSIIHSTPAIFGEDKSQAIIGVQMASAYIGYLVVVPVFGLIARASSALWMPLYMLVFFVLMITMHEYIQRKRSIQSK
ncbi:MFS transporter [Alloscardovia theropitheci]|uniref:MFS transporter n=1 Tax=Alloscardovia theropitheci TaxID=2496842 RepID=A0A4R0QR52_9BIFI|nr:MFS transporter [Alloscardovia theropitheci]TCD54832.1 MFS transporter [Alloscardovia theropitheci]